MDAPCLFGRVAIGVVVVARHDLARVSADELGDAAIVVAGGEVVPPAGAVLHPAYHQTRVAPE